MRINIFDGLLNGVMEVRSRRKILKQTLGAALTLTTGMPNRLVLDPAAARTITLPPESAGLWFEITNAADALENITVVEDAGSVTQCIIGVGQTVTIWSDGTSWFTSGAGDLPGVVNITTATVTLTRAAHAGKLITLNRAAGIVVTLPAAIGSGAVFEFLVGTAFTAAGTISVANSADTMLGKAFVAQDGADTCLMFDGGGTDDSVNMNGGTRGGAAGDIIKLRDAAANLWMAECFVTGTGTEATPFSAMVA
jgi:hypothetical protein